MRIISVDLWLPYALLFFLGLVACTPQLAEPEPIASPIINLPTEAATESSILPTPVAQLVTQAPTSTNTPEPTETPLPTSTSLPPTETPPPTATPTTHPATQDQQEPAIYAVVGVASDDVLNVRSEPGVENDVVGELPYNAIGVELLGEEVLIDESPWGEIQYEDISGWVNLRFLAVQYGEPDKSAATAHAILTALNDEDWETLATFVHPDKGVRFSPYTYVRDEHIVLSSAEVASLNTNQSIYNWGRFDGTGDPIDLTFADYYARFIFNTNFYRPHTIGFNQFIGWSNTINNILDFYPDADFVEYHFPGFNPDYDGMDWASLRLVMEEVDGEWKLVGVVHSEWTI